MEAITSREVEGVLVLKPGDPLGINDGQSDHYRVRLYEIVENLARPRLALDLGALDYVSSSGVAFLISIRRRVAAAHGNLVLFAVHPYVADVLRVMKLASLFRIARDETEAIEALPGIEPA